MTEILVLAVSGLMLAMILFLVVATISLIKDILL